MNRQQKALKHICRDGIGLEIGPSHNPIAPKKDGFQVEIVDHASREELVKKYHNHGVNLDNIEDVDYIWDGRRYPELVGKTNYYDWIIASHLIEHQPDLIGFLNDCDAILKDDGVLSLIIPDKRYCFDYYRPITGLSQIIDGHYNNAKVHSPGTIAEYYLNVVSNRGSIAWGPNVRERDFAFVHSLADAEQQMHRTLDTQEYIDVHAWCFVPHSFRLIVHDLFSLGLIPFQEVDFFPTDGCEFFVTLGRQSKPSTQSRLKMLEMIESEMMASYASPTIDPEPALSPNPIQAPEKSINPSQKTRNPIKRFLSKVKS
jgi:hypothetical protein